MVLKKGLEASLEDSPSLAGSVLRALQSWPLLGVLLSTQAGGGPISSSHAFAGAAHGALLSHGMGLL